VAAPDTAVRVSKGGTGLRVEVFNSIVVTRGAGEPRPLAGTPTMNDAKIIVALCLVGGTILWELFSGKIPSRHSLTRRMDSPIAYWIGIVLQLVLFGYIAWLLDFKAIGEYPFLYKMLFGAGAFVWTTLLIVATLFQLTRDDSREKNDSDNPESAG
jgi:hypothetical protein